MGRLNENQIKEELKTKLSTISSVFIIAQDAYLYTEYFHNPNTYTRSSPLYIGKKSGSNITRIGVNSPLFGDLFQNGFHFLMGSPYFGRGNFGVSPFYQTGNYSPSIMY